MKYLVNFYNNVIRGTKADELFHLPGFWITLLFTILAIVMYTDKWFFLAAYISVYLLYKLNIQLDEKNKLDKVINKSELNQDVTIIPEKPINIELTTNKQETKDKVYENTTTETYKLKETGDKYVNLTDEEKAINEEMKKRFDNQEKEYKKAFKGKNELDYDGSVITDENIYQFGDFSYINANQLFIPTDYKTKEEDYGRNYIPPELWYKNNQRLNLPVCVPANGRCTIKDNLTSGYPLDVVEWHSSRKVMNPDGINQEYINEKLNTNSDIGSIKEIVREVIKETNKSGSN